MRRVAQNNIKQKVSVKSGLSRLGSAVAKDFLISNGILIDEEWTFTKCLKFVVDNKEHHDKVYRILNNE